MLIILTILYATTADCMLTNGNASSADNAQSPLLESLRRQLMEDNYDYQSIETTNETTTEPAAEIPQASPEGRFRVVQERAEGGRAGNPAEEQAWRDFESNRVINDVPQFESHEKVPLFKVHDNVIGLDAVNLQKESKAVPHFRSGVWEKENPIESQKPSHVVSKKDLLYYLDENSLRRSQDTGDDSDRPQRRTMDYEELYPNDDEVTTPKVKYKLIKVRDGYRRNGRVHRYLQERGSKGVAFISLDAAPFPQFKLPRSRRQYMQDIGDKSFGTETEDDELVPNGYSQHEDI